MEKKRKHKPDPVLQRLGTLRMVLCVIAVVCCAGIVFSAVNLAAPPKQTETKGTEAPKETVNTELPPESAAPQDGQEGESTESTTVETAEPPGDQEMKEDGSNDNGNKKDGGSSWVNSGDQGGSEDPESAGKGNSPGIRSTAMANEGKPALTAPEATEQVPAEAETEATEQVPAEGETEATEQESTEAETEVTEQEPAETGTEAVEQEPAVPETTQADPSGTGSLGNEISALPSADPRRSAETEETPKAPGWALPLLIGSIFGLLVDLGGIAICTRSIGARKKELQSQRRKAEVQRAYVVPEETGTTQVQTLQEQEVPGGMTVGSLQNIGGRPYQEDSSGVASLSDGILAVVADGMGGLANGDKVSQKIVMTMMGYSKSLRPGQMDDVLPRMVQSVAAEVNKMLGPEGLYKSGSTLMTVLVRQNRFHWAAVGDSHIYLYREGQLVQLNQEHNRGQELLYQALAGELTFDEVRADPKKSGLTSFVGMGELKYVEKSLSSIALKAGDRILLMTDGVFNALSDQEIAAVLARNPDVKTAAQMMERGVLAKAAPHQDNFTAIILGF